MNEEEYEKSSALNEADHSAPAPDESGRPDRRRPMFIALGIIGVVVLAAALFLLLRNRESGQVVPAPRTVSFDATDSGQPVGDADGQTITLAPDQIERAGIKVETVGETLSAEGASMSTTGVVQPNAYAETPVISLVGGVVRRVNANLGENVSRGQTVAVIFSDELAAAQSRYVTLQTEVRTSRQNYDRATRLVRINPLSRGELDVVQAKLKSNEAALDEMRRRYARTVKLVEIGASSREELEQDRTKLRSAEAEVEQARSQFQRAAQVVQINPLGNADLEQAAVKLRTAESDLASARQRLLLLGFSESRVSALRSPSQISSELALAAPVSGTVTARTVNQGEAVEANKELLKITNLSTVWVVAQVYESAVGALRVGTGASVTSDAFPGRLFRGRVTYIDPNINAETRTAQARVELENPGQIFRIGQYVNVALGAAGGAERTIPTVPSPSVQMIGNRQAVFAATAEPNIFSVRYVRLTPEKDGRYGVLEGLNVGDKVVTDGSFLLRAEWLRQNPGS